MNSGSCLDLKEIFLLYRCKLSTNEVYDKAIENEKVLTPFMHEVASDVGGKLIGLENRIKSASSVIKKIRKKADFGINEDEAINSMGDLVRYTLQVEHDLIAYTAIMVMDKFARNGYNIKEVDNKYAPGSDDTYKAVHINIESPMGQIFELQIHSSKSLEVKKLTHRYYEESRDPSTSTERRIELKEIMKSITQKLRMPKYILGIISIKISSTYKIKI